MADARMFREYVRKLQAAVSRGNATEHTHRPALKELLESALDGIIATNEPKRVECGAPDYAISRKQGGLTIGYVEAKDIGVSLADIEQDSARANPSTVNGRQFKRYRESLPNLLLTDYTEFRWYADGQRRAAARLAQLDGSGKLSLRNDGIAETDALLFDFLRHSPEPVTGPEELARRMARLTHLAREIVAEGFRLGKLSADVSDLYLASKEVLVPDLSQDAFADMFAQTLAYGLFAARVNHPRENGDSGEFNRHVAARHIPQANPFIRRIFALVSDPALDDEPFAGFVDDLAQLLGNTDMEAALSGFGARAARQDPILHFYETFLAAYDPALRERRGVYYTPEPVVSYIVRSVDRLLRERFDCPEGLADYSTVAYNTLEYDGNEEKTVERQSHRVLVLDPACGTGSFLYAVIDHIREYYRSADNAGMWDGYVREHLLPRLFGFELLMAPYAMAHLKLGMQLAGQDLPADDRPDWAYDFANSERLGVYLTNSLEEGEMQVPMSGPYRIITDEANSAAEIKRDFAIFHSPTYRERYDQFLRADFPRVPLVDDVELFRTLVELGSRLTRAHLLESNPSGQPAVSFPVPGDNVVEKGYPKYCAPGETPPALSRAEGAPLERGRVYISANGIRSNKRGQYFEGIPPEVWEFLVGGYQPMDKWLKDRRGRALSYDDLSHYRRMGSALQETIGLMEEVDRAINDSDYWRSNLNCDSYD